MFMIYTLNVSRGHQDICSSLSNGSAKKACVAKGEGKETGRGMDGEGKDKKYGKVPGGSRC